MPASRGEDPFQNVAEDRTKIFCRLCNLTIQKTSKPGHIRSKNHVQNVEIARLENGQGSAIMQFQSTSTSPPVHAPKSVSFSHLDDLLASDSSDDDEPSGETEFFRDILVDPRTGTYLDANGQSVTFSAGGDLNHEQEVHKKMIHDEFKNLALLEGNSVFGRFDRELDDQDAPDSNDVLDDSVGQLSAAIEDLHMPSDDEDDDVVMDQEPEKNSRWWPYPSKQAFLIDMLDSQPRQRLSDDQLKTVLWVMRECGTPNLPTFSGMRRIQDRLTKQFGLLPRHHVSSLGNHFYMNHPEQLFAMDFANPLVRKYLHLYPDVNSKVSETWQAAKWLDETELDDLSPMWANWHSVADCHRHFYVSELAQTRDLAYVVPLRWVTVGGRSEVHADVFDVDERENHFSVRTGTTRRIPAAHLYRNLLDLMSRNDWKSKIIGEYSPTRFFEKHLLRTVADGKPLFRLRITPWSDDVSGNVSKQYNAHTNIYATNANLPHEKLSQEYFVRACSTSSFASSSEQFVALAEDFRANHWYNAYDCELEQEILFQVIPHVLPADNPQQSETSSHLGVNANLNCRRDLTGGSDEQKETLEGYESLYVPGTPRECEQTIQTIRWQLWLACQGNSEGIKSISSNSGIKDKIAQGWIEKLLAKAKVQLNEKLRNVETRDPRLNSRMTRDGRKELIDQITLAVGHELWTWLVQQPDEEYSQLAEDDPARQDIRAGVHYNILLQTRGINPHADTPGEILHTYLLGNDKYVWHSTNKTWTKVEDEIFAIRLQSSSITGLTLPPIRSAYLVQYKNSLIGKHFKILQQLGIFHIHDLCPPEVFQLWKCTGELGAMLWYPEIRNMDQYLADLTVLIDNLLDAWAAVDARRILTKAKLHVLVHLPDDVRRFGPAVIYATEIFECFNAIFRMCSVLSNHLAPSRDITLTLGGLERFKHMVSGGWWKDDESGQYVCAGSSILCYFKDHREVQRRLGWVDHSEVKPGFVKKAPRKKRCPACWTEHVRSSNILKEVPDHYRDETWDVGSVVISQSRDMCRVGSWVFCQEANTRHTMFAGRILRILARTSKLSSETVVLIERFELLDTLNTRLNMPILVRTTTKEVYPASPQDIMFDFNVQHDCVSQNCRIGDTTRKQVQERLETEKVVQYMIHTEDDHFVINMHALHNAHLIREVLPRELVSPKPLHIDRSAFHRQLAAQLQVSGPQKRAAAQAKSRETREKNRQAK